MRQKLKTLPKTRFVAFVASSADGRISLANKTSPDWTSKEDWNFLQKELLKVDAVVVGLNTYRAESDLLRRRNSYVLSDRLAAIKRIGTVTFVNPKNVGLNKLLSKYKTVAVLGGNSVYQYMLSHDLLDEIYITIEPLIFGRGKEMFAGGKKTSKISLLSVKKLNKTGTLLLHYKIGR